MIGKYLLSVLAVFAVFGMSPAFAHHHDKDYSLDTLGIVLAIITAFAVIALVAGKSVLKRWIGNGR